MAKLRSVFRCSSCGASSPKWVGRCPQCEAWNTLAEEVERPGPGPSPVSPAQPAVPIADVDAAEYAPRATGVSELDRVLGGGLVPGSVTLLGGEPGIGKSTLLLQVASEQAAAGRTVLYVSAEESRQQVRLRAERLGALRPRLWLAADTSVPEILGQVDEVAPDLLIVDSIQAVHDPDLGSAPGTVGQVRECAHRFVTAAKGRDLATVLVGHVTKEGALAGPRVLEHVVDTVVSFEGDRHHALRLVRAVKHRFGPTNELGLFEMTEGGLVALADASAMLLSDRQRDVPGSVVVPTVEGQRPLLVEVQALLAPTPLSNPRRSAQGLDAGRLSMLIAVLGERAGVALQQFDVFGLAVGGVRLNEPAADLALALALVSARANRALPGDLVAVAEVGLGGELRQVSHLSRRLEEAARLGFGQAVVPASTPECPTGLRPIRASTLAEAVQALGLSVPQASGRARYQAPYGQDRSRPPGRAAWPPADWDPDFLRHIRGGDPDDPQV